MSWVSNGAPSSFTDLIGLRPNLAADLQRFGELLWQGRGIDPVTLELCRLRVAMLHRCAAELARRSPQARAAGLGEARIARLEDWHRDPAFTARERACLEIAEQFVIDPSAMDDRSFGAARTQLGEAGMVTLLEALAVFDGFTRFQVLLQAAAESRTPTADSTAAGAASAVAEPADLAPVRSADQSPRGGSGPRILPPAGAGNDPIRGSALGHQPELLEAFNRLYGTLWSRGVLDHSSKETARLRNARITNCVFCRNVRFAGAREEGLGEEQVAQITDDFETSTLDERAKRVIRYADVFLKDPHGLNAELRAAMSEEFTPEQIVELTAGLALFMGFSKIAVSIGGMPDSLPTMLMPTPR